MKIKTAFFLTLMTVSGCSSVVLAGDAPKSTPESVADGKKLFQTNCVTCHGEKADGDGPAGKYLQPKPRNLATDSYKKGESSEEVYKTLTQGLDGTAMPGFGTLSEADRWKLVHYVRSLKAGKKAQP